MIIEINPKKKSALEQVMKILERHPSIRPIVSEGDLVTLVGLEGDARKIDDNSFRSIEGVVSVERITAPYKIVARQISNGEPGIIIRKPDKVVDVGGRKIGNGYRVFIAGPCAVHSRDMLLEIASGLAEIADKLNIKNQIILRGGAWKPRSNPYLFQGLGWEAVDCLDEAREKTGLPYVTEVVDTRHVEQLAKRADMLQIGARNCTNIELLKEVGRHNKPVLLKREIHGISLDYWLQMAEYIALEGNTAIVLCERGFCERGRENGDDYHRNTLDYDIIPVVKERSNLPIIVDPSHGTGKWHLVAPAARSAMEFGADGTIIEVIADSTDPSAVCDGQQSLRLKKYSALVASLLDRKQE